MLRKSIAPVVISVMLLASYMWLGFTNLSATMTGLTRRTGPWASSDTWLAQTGVASSSEGLRSALGGLPEGDLILFVASGPEPDLGYSLVYFHTYYFGSPRNVAVMRCDGPDGSPVFVGPIPSGSKKLAGVVFYPSAPPAKFSQTIVLSPRLTVVPLSKSLEEISNWTYFCRQ